MFLKNPDNFTLKANGNDDFRVGDNRRNASLKDINRIEDLLLTHLKRDCVMDINCNEGPDFKLYTYSDVLGGIRLSTSSMEINARIVKDLISDDITVEDFPLSGVTDKYALKPVELTEEHSNVILMTGSNFHHAMQQEIIISLMTDPDEEWFIKPHPITAPELVEETAKRFGRWRIFDTKTSGLAVYRNAKKIVTTATSEFLLLAALEQKPCVDMTRVSLFSICAYGDIAVHLPKLSHVEKQTAVNRALMHPKSGYLHPSMSDEEIVQRIHDYRELAEELRKPFKSVIGQILMATDLSGGIWTRSRNFAAKEK